MAKRKLISEGMPCTRVSGPPCHQTRKPRLPSASLLRRRNAGKNYLNCGRNFELGQSVCRASELELMEFRAFTSLPYPSDATPYALETDWPVGAAGFEPLHFRIGIGQDSQPWGRDSNLRISI